MTTKKQRDRAKERRREKRIIDVGVGRKKTKDAMVEEALEETFDWIERGGWRRLWTVLKITFFTLIALIVLGVLVFLEYSWSPIIF